MKKAKKTKPQPQQLENQYLEGEGLGSFISEKYAQAKSAVTDFFSPRLNDFNNISKKTISDLGNFPITSLAIYRTPINSIINKALNIISFGKWEKLKARYGFDRLFHLALVATVNAGGTLKNVIMEKNEVVNVSTSYKTDHQTEIYQIPLNPNQKLTVSQILNNARQKVGDKTFFSYDAFKNNCQFFIKYLLEGVNLYTDGAKNFLFQDLTEIIKGLPSYIGQIANAVTTTGAVVSKLSGKGSEADQIKGLSRGVTSLAENIPVLGEAVSVLSKPINAATDFFVDEVISPLFLDQRKAQISKDWANYIKEESLRKYGQELTPDEYRTVKHYELQQKTEAKNEAYSQGVRDFEQKAKDAGFNSTAEYSKFLRDQNRERLRQKKQNQQLQGQGKDNYELHTVVIKKTVPLEEAKKLAKPFMTTKGHFMRETENSYRFRNIPKSKFKARKYRSKVINDDITLVYGELRNSP